MLRACWEVDLVTSQIFIHDQYSKGHEVDCLIESSGKLIPIEIKSGETIKKDFFKDLTYWKDISKVETDPYLISGGDEGQIRREGKVLSWKNLVELLED